MKDQLVNLLTSKVGLNQQLAEQCVDAVIGYLMSNPDHLKSILDKIPGGNVGSTILGFFGQGGKD